MAARPGPREHRQLRVRLRRRLSSITDFNGNSTVGNTADGLTNSLTLGSSGDTINTTYDPTDTPSDISLADATPTTPQEFAYNDAPSGAISEETDTPSSSLEPRTLRRSEPGDRDDAGQRVAVTRMRSTPPAT